MHIFAIGQMLFDKVRGCFDCRRPRVLTVGVMSTVQTLEVLMIIFQPAVCLTLTISRNASTTYKSKSVNVRPLSGRPTFVSERDQWVLEGKSSRWIGDSRYKEIWILWNDTIQGDHGNSLLLMLFPAIHYVHAIMRSMVFKYTLCVLHWISYWLVTL